jgi:hypothetical protein
MKSIVLTGFIAAIAIAVTTVGFGFTIAEAQMADNASMGNMTGGNMTMGTGNVTESNSTEAAGSISGVEGGF